MPSKLPEGEIKMLRVIPLFVLLLAAGPTYAQPPDFTSLMTPPGGYSPLPGTAPRMQTAADSAAASTDSAISDARSQVENYRNDTRERGNAEQRAAAARQKVANLAQSKVYALDEMRRGEFCSGCNQTKSYILAHDNPPVFPHPGQHVIPATQDQLDAKAAEFDNLIRNAQADAVQANQEVTTWIRQQQQARDGVTRSLLQWRQNMVNEDDARARSWDQQMDTFKSRFQAGQDAINTLNQAIEQIGHSRLQGDVSIKDLQSNLRAARDMMGMLDRDAQEAYGEQRREIDQFYRRMERGKQGFSNMLMEVGGPSLITPSLPNIEFSQPEPFSAATSPPFGFQAPLPKVPTPFTLRMGGSSIEMSVTGPCMSQAKIEASGDWLRSKLNVNLTMGLTTPFGYAGFGMSQSTAFGPNGVTITSSPTWVTPGNPFVGMMVPGSGGRQ